MSNKPTRRLIYGTNMAVMIVTVVLIVGFINYLGAKHYKRWNLVKSTSEQLSDQTISILKNLKNDVTLTYLYTNLSPGQEGEDPEETRQTFIKMLERYKSISPRFSYEMIDYAKNPLRAREFMKTLKNINLEEGSSIVKSGEHVEKINDTSESALTQAIIKVTTGKERTVCFTEGHGEHDPDVTDTGGYSTARRGLEAENYAIKKINVLRDGVPDTCNVVLIVGPLVPFQAEEAERLKKWIDAGGKAMILLEPTGQTGLESIMNEYGIAADDDVLKTDDAASMGIDPFEIYSQEYDPNHPITAALSQTRFMAGDSLQKIPMRMFEARSLKVADPGPPGVEDTTLVSTIEAVKAFPTSSAPSAKALKRIPGANDAAPGSERPLTETKSFVVAAAAKKALASSPESPAATPEATTPDEEKNEKSVRLVIFGDSDWAADGYIDQLPSGDMFMNSVAWLAEEEASIGIRPREKKFIPIQVTGMGGWLFLGGILLVVPAVLILNAALISREKKRM